MLKVLKHDFPVLSSQARPVPVYSFISQTQRVAPQLYEFEMILNNTLSMHSFISHGLTIACVWGGGITVYRLLCNFDNMVFTGWLRRENRCRGKSPKLKKIQTNTELKKPTHKNTTTSYTTCSYYICSHQFVLYMCSRFLSEII